MASLAFALEPENTPLSLLELPARAAPCATDRRSLPRVAECFEIRMGDDNSTCHGKDLSFGGFLCTSEAPLWPGNTVEVELLLPGDSSPVQARGQVVDLVPSRGDIAMRVRFVDIAQPEKKRIAAFMARAHGA